MVIHCATKKGYGYNRAERRPEDFHGTPPFLVETGEVSGGSRQANGEVAMHALINLARKDPRIMAVTAAMPLGTCTHLFEEAFPTRHFDVGIAEEHAVTMCAGMASGGLRPFFFVYSTFLQRGYDQVLHDVCIQRLPVVLMLDRAGISNEDGQSHQGLYDFAYLRHIPYMTVLAPADAAELEAMIPAAMRLGAPCAIRYPKNAERLPEGYAIDGFEIGRWQTLRCGNDAALVATGTMTAAALRVADRLEEEDVHLTVVNASTVKPLDDVCLDALFARHIPILTMEEHVAKGGFGSAVLEYACAVRAQACIRVLAVGDFFVQHGDHAHLLKDVGLDDESVAQAVLHTVREAGVCCV